ncbi:hypothetical protein SI65_08978 [Aspergillus cristatus]|uniref:MATH and UCH domain protein n=1 Tax=Aspergillus cristatus TaxID=573508 RepID=A0A1E3B493_ASPCR|nr:hypothetical protein SI65_08978 [Aspergillus cristatus]
MDSSNPSQNPQQTDNAQSPPEQQTPVSNSAPSPALEHAYWAEFEEDPSVPDEAEMRDIESKADSDTSATKYDYWEKTFYPDLNDPEYRPVEKARLSWKLKGVRGTKECPNWAKVMRSPAAYIGGYWWTIKFFPRGNNTKSLSIYLECSTTMPTPDKTLPESEFKVLRGTPDATLNDCTPDLDLKTVKTDDSAAWLDMYKSKYPPAAARREHSQDWRVAAQVGVIIYNPDEPRTGWMQSSCHQFNPHNLDWGWTDFHGPWDKIHIRQSGQRQPLLRNDTLAFDAYIRIIDDPTHSLWWHRSVTEHTWDSLGLTGYRPLGDSGINHSAEVAGLASWLQIAPFCNIIQSVDVLEHLTNCEVKPKPLCDALQKVLWKLRSRSEPLQYVETDVVTATLRNLNEYSSDVTEFWERLRRGLELELAGTKAGEEFAKLFDSPSVAQLSGALEPVNTLPQDYNSRICVPADEVKTTGEALTKYLSTKPGRWALPPVLNIELNRHKLDKATKQWRLLYNRVEPDEELDLTEQVPEGQCGRYVLYGYIVHRGRRTSGKFFSILRPGGPGAKWFAFDDGSDKRVECLTRKTAFGQHLGLDASKKPDQKTGHDVAVVMMYIRSDVVGEFLPGPQGPCDAPEDMREYYEKGEYPFNKTVDGRPVESDLQVEVYSLPNYNEMGSLFDTYDLMSRAKSSNNVMYLSVPRSSTFVDLRKKVSFWKSSGGDTISSEHVRLWQIGHTLDRHGPTLAFSRVSNLNDALDLPAKVARFWMQVVSDEEAKYFAMPDPPKTIASVQKPQPTGAVVEQRSSESIHEVDDSADPALPGQPPENASNDGQPSAPTPPSLAEGNPDSDAAFARRIASEIRQIDRATASEAQQQPTPLAEPVTELTIQTRIQEASEHAERQVQLPVPHVYYFLQLFNADTQTLRTIGTFFSRAEENIKFALRTHLPHPPKDILIWQRTDTTTLISLSASETFTPATTPDGTCFIVSEHLSTQKRTSLHAAGNFSTPDPLLTYLWATARKHPTQSFTGTTTLPVTFTSDYYTGALHKGHYHGHGTHITPLGNIYTGTFIFSRRHGHGTMEYPSGDTYEGDWANDVCHGQGTYIEAKTGNKYVGGYKDGKRSGKGISYWEVVNEEMDLCQICYGGEKDACFFDCGHVCACVGCARMVDLCPICRRRIVNVVKIYRT